MLFRSDDGDDEGWDQGDEGKGSGRVLTLRCVIFYCFLEYSTVFFFTVNSTYDDQDVDSDDKGWDQRQRCARLDPQVCDFLLFFRLLIFFTVHSTYQLGKGREKDGLGIIFLFFSLLTTKVFVFDF